MPGKLASAHVLMVMQAQDQYGAESGGVAASSRRGEAQLAATLDADSAAGEVISVQGSARASTTSRCASTLNSLKDDQD